MSENESPKAKLLSATAILQALDLEPVTLEIPEWKGTIRLRPLTAEEGISVTKMLQQKGKSEEGAIRLLIASAIDENGNQLFTEDDLRKLSKKCVSAFMRVQAFVLKMNGFNAVAQEDAKND